MRIALGVLFGSLGVVAGALSLGCKLGEDTDSGDSLGSFVVRGQLEENACAPGLDPIDPLEFRVDLTLDGEALKWRLPGGQPIYGTLDEDGELRVQSASEVVAWPPDEVNGIVGCTLRQVETVEAVVTMMAATDGDASVSDDAGVPSDASQSDGGVTTRRVAGFTGVNSVRITPAGGDCSALLLVYGGQFPTLPCEASYEIEAELIDDADDDDEN